VVQDYAKRIFSYLLAQGVKAVVIACNTATAVALRELEVESPVPVIGVVSPGAEAALRRTRTGRVGVLATQGTVRAGAYQHELVRRCPTIEVHQRAAGSLVEAVERGLAHTVEMERLVWPLLSELVALGCDTIILGCTHFPVIRDIFDRLASPDVAIVDSAVTTAEALAEVNARIGTSTTLKPVHSLFVTAEAEAFARQASLLFGQRVSPQPLKMTPVPNQVDTNHWRVVGEE
jgi:glutamate racemase